MIDAEKFSQLLVTLYAAPLDENQWSVFLTQLCDTTGSMHAQLTRNSSAMGVQLSMSGGTPGKRVAYQTYKTNFKFTDPAREAFMRHPVTGVVDGDDLLSYEDLDQTPAYKATMEAHGARYLTLLTFVVSTRVQEVISLFRTERRREAPETVALLKLLLPHIENALRLQRTLGLAGQRVHDAEDMLDASPSARILLDHDGRIVRMNRAAESIVAADDTFGVQGGRLLPHDPTARSDFRKAVLDCAATETAHGGQALALPRPGGRRALHVLVAPLRLKHGPRSSARVLVLATDPDETAHFSDTLLRQLYEVTSAEADVANALLMGYSPGETARLRGVSVATVRSQLKSLMAKTGTQRQGDLIRLLSTLPRLGAHIEKSL